MSTPIITGVKHFVADLCYPVKKEGGRWREEGRERKTRFGKEEKIVDGRLYDCVEHPREPTDKLLAIIRNLSKLLETFT